VFQFLFYFLLSPDNNIYNYLMGKQNHINIYFELILHSFIMLSNTLHKLG